MKSKILTILGALLLVLCIVPLSGCYEADYPGGYGYGYPAYSYGWGHPYYGRYYSGWHRGDRDHDDWGHGGGRSFAHEGHGGGGHGRG